MSLEALLSPPAANATPGRQAAWLRAAAAALGGFRPVPLVVRRSGGDDREPLSEIRRWSEARFVRLGGDDLLLDEKGGLFALQPERRRWLRRSEREWIHDDVFALSSAAVSAGVAVEAVTGELIAQHGLLFWSRWPAMTAPQRHQLLGVPQPWAVLGAALQADEAVAGEALPGLLGPQAHPSNRQALLAAGAAGSYTPPAAILPFLLLQPDWNRSAGLLGLVGAAVASDPERAWVTRRHANSTVRRRLAELLPNGQRWLEWLAQEADDGVRQTVRRRLESESAPEELLLQVVAIQDPAQRSALLWAAATGAAPRDAQHEARLQRWLSPLQRERWLRRPGALR